jgi:outer membrane protein
MSRSRLYTICAVGSAWGGAWTRVLAAFLLFACLEGAHAETGAVADTISLTLSDAVARALGNSPHLEALSAGGRGADAAVRGARAAGLPALDVTAGYTRYSSVPEFALTLPNGSRQTIAPDIPDAWRTRAAVSVPLWTGGRIASTTEAARNDRDAAQSDLDAARGDLVLETTAAYWNLRMRREQMTVVRRALAAYDAHLKDARQRALHGLAARNEVLAIEVEHGRAELGLVKFAGAATISEENLRRLLNVGESVAIVVADEPDLPATARSLELTPADRPPGGGSEFDSLVAVAFELRPERKAMLARAQAAESRVRAESGARWPQIATVAGYDYSNPNRRQTPPHQGWSDSWDASVTLQLPVFDSGRISASVARARAQADAMWQQLEDLDRHIRLEVAGRAIETRSAETAVAVAERAVESAIENVRVTRDRYREGVATSSDLLDAEVQDLQAALDRTDARTVLLLARAQLDRAVGRLR